MEDYFDLGTYTRPITTSSPDAQLWFDRGLNWSYAFNHAEAVKCFEKVIEHDPDCAMGYWGIAYETGPYYNLPWPKFSAEGLPLALKKTHHYSREAAKRVDGITSVEKAIIEAQLHRFQAPQVSDPDVFSKWDDDYANAMREVYAQYPADYDVAALTAEALICRTPWLLWDLVNEVEAEGADTAEANSIIEKGIAQAKANGDQQHPGLLHFYTHIQEMAPDPERALEACDTLMTLMPDGGHLVHMPSHIYILCGMYEEAYESNRLAGIADRKFIAYDDTLGIYTLYWLHNIHFKVYAALFLGQYQKALDSAEEAIELIPPEGLHHEHAFIVTYLEAYSGMLPHVYIRFGKWQEIIDAPLPPDPDLYVFTTALWHYAKGIAYAATGDIANAAKHQTQFATAVENVPADKWLWNNYVTDILGVAEMMLAGELEYRRENYDAAFDHLRESVRRYDALLYTEPWAWMHPPRHALGALLLEQGHVEESAAVYRADLGLDKTLVRPSQHPDNIWSLQGYADCLEQMDRPDELAAIQEKLAIARQKTDIDITSSCFCKQSSSDDCCTS